MKCRGREYAHDHEQCKAYHRAWSGRNREYLNEWYRKWRRKLREEMLAAYGGKCECCGEATYEFLSIDHMGGRPKGEKRGLVTYQLYAWLKREGWPRDGYRLLCNNCNQSFGQHGYCPHSKG